MLWAIQPGIQFSIHSHILQNHQIVWRKSLSPALLRSYCKNNVLLTRTCPYNFWKLPEVTLTWVGDCRHAGQSSFLRISCRLIWLAEKNACSYHQNRIGNLFHGNPLQSGVMAWYDWTAFKWNSSTLLFLGSWQSKITNWTGKVRGPSLPNTGWP